MPILAVGEGSDATAAIVEAFAAAREMLSTAFATAPALMLGLAVIATLPILIAGGAVLRRLAAKRVVDRTRRADRTTRLAASGEADIPVASANAGKAAPAYSQAVIAVEADDDGDEAEPREAFRFGSAMIVRIGREEDNEVRLKHPTVHRYHALIRRSYEEGYEISDLSDAGGNGVMVNGQRTVNSPLADGDEIALGAARLRFGLTQ